MLVVLNGWIWFAQTGCRTICAKRAGNAIRVIKLKGWFFCMLLLEGRKDAGSHTIISRYPYW